jgi:RHS repeat-associated protein
MQALALTTDRDYYTRAANEDCINGGPRTRTKYGYDVLDRLTSAMTASATFGWTYDANGNRLTQTGTTAVSLATASSSNRVTSTSGSLVRSYTYNAAGNTLTYTGTAFTYYNSGRMKTATVGGSTTTYVYNAQGQRIEKSEGVSGTVFNMYDEAGHLLGEYTATGGLTQETIYLGDIPVATLRPSGSTIAIYYVHSDSLNTPRAVTRPSDNAFAWQWHGDAFGNGTPAQNPQGLGTFVYNLRFPGQYYDSESGLNYNYFRDYDPATGRYVESDPIGLDGGVNTYGYARDNPLSNVDPSGQNPAIAAPIIVGGIVVGGICASIPSCRDAAANIARIIGNYCRNLATESNEAREQRCQENLDRDLETCKTLGKRNGKAAYTVCERQAYLRYGNCLSGRDSGIDAPLPPWSLK